MHDVNFSRCNHLVTYFFVILGVRIVPIQLALAVARLYLKLVSNWIGNQYEMLVDTRNCNLVCADDRKARPTPVRPCLINLS
jgi:hypothetical protein